MDSIIHLNAAAPAKDDLPAGLAGVVDSVSHGMEDVFKPGDQVMACLPVAATTGSSTPGSTVAVNGRSVCVKPSCLGFGTAAKVAQVLPLVATVLAEGSVLDTSGADQPAETQQESSVDQAPETALAAASCIVVTAGETLLGTLLAYLIKQRCPTAQLLCTCSGPNVEVHVATCNRLVLHAGAIYAIDGDAPELMDHLPGAIKEYSGNNGMDLIVDVGGLIERRPEVREVLREDSKVVNVEGLRARRMLWEGSGEQDGLVSRVARMLENVTEELFEGVEVGGISDNGQE